MSYTLKWKHLIKTALWWLLLKVLRCQNSQSTCSQKTLNRKPSRILMFEWLCPLCMHVSKSTFFITVLSESVGTDVMGYASIWYMRIYDFCECTGVCMCVYMSTLYICVGKVYVTHCHKLRHIPLHPHMPRCGTEVWGEKMRQLHKAYTLTSASSHSPPN